MLSETPLEITSILVYTDPIGIVVYILHSRSQRHGVGKIKIRDG